MIFHFELFGRYYWGEAVGEKCDGFARNGKYVSICGGKPLRERERGRERERAKLEGLDWLGEKYLNVNLMLTGPASS